MTRPRLLFPAVALLFACACASQPPPRPEVRLRLALEVISDPPRAEVSFRGKAVGETPASIAVTTYDELEGISAASGDLTVVEKRLRLLSSDKAHLIFRFGRPEQQSPLARTLGVQNVLIFDYSEKVAFDVDRFDLKPDALPILNTQADILSIYFPHALVYVCGYTDATGSEEHNLRLSLKRAQAVADYLVARGIDKDRLKIRGFGKDYPVETNATAAGRALNRRTEVILPQ
jgi:outer membrane protein OmpA-like peptidoglycan-associated protein